MKKFRALSLLLSLSLLTSLAIPGTMALPISVVGEQQDNEQQDNEQQNNGMVISKTAKANDDGSYTITLEAYATGDKIITETKKDVPTDIILVLDQSGSMADPMSSEQAYSAYEDRSNRELHVQRFNNGNDNLYYPVDGGYVEVQVDRTIVDDYVPLDNDTKNHEYYNYYKNLYIKNADGTLQQVTINRSGPKNNYTYEYNLAEGRIIKSSGKNTVPAFGAYGPIYWYGEVYQYTYYYILAGQARVDIETSFGADAVPAESYYKYEMVNTSRLEALESAVTMFADSVATKAKGPDGILGNADDVNHRVAVVGFASKNGYGNNTELLSIDGNNSGSVGVKYDSITKQNLIDVLQDMDTTAGQNMVQSAIDALDAEGATQADLGMDMAYRILSANPVPEGEKRARVVVFFTDGSPTSSNGFENAVANEAINKASSIKGGGAFVYSVGVFPGADATVNGVAQGNGSRQENQFMQDMSSNNGTPQNPGYYLSASDSETLNSIFQKISEQIETGGSSTTLNENTVIRDIIAPEFTLSEGTTADKITLEIYSYEGENQWEKNDTTNINATASIDGDRVDVTGFDFAKNYVGTVTKNGVVTDYRGNKLVISFTVEPKTGFLGGNNVYTNTGAGIYENATSKEPVLTFNRPQVNVPIKNVNVTAEDKNVYLLNGLTASDLRSGATAKVGDGNGDVYLSLDPKKGNYGLETWQTSGVDISVVIKDAGGNVVNDDLTGLRDDTTYTVEIQVSPKETALSASDGDAATTKYGTATANINVFKPELTYQDSKVYYGDAVPTDFTVATTWKHHGKTEIDTTVADTTTMPNVPELTIDYTVDATKVNQGKINSKQDIGVDTLIKIDGTDVTGDTTFFHKACETACGWENPITGGTPAFLLHVQTCQLTVSKTDGAEDEPYVFTVYKYDEDNKDNKEYIEYSEITIVGNNSETIFELPVGTYTIEEDTGWSWRYDTNNGGSVKLTAKKTTGSITCSNTKTENYWLNGFSNVIKNIFGIKN